MPYRMLLFAAAFQNGCCSRTALTVPILRSGTLQGIAQAPPYSVPAPKLKYGVHDYSTALHLYAKEQPLLTVYLSHVDSCASCVHTEAVLPHTGERRCNVWKLHFVRTTPTLTTLSSSDGPLSSLIAACLYGYCARVNKLHSALLCWDLLVGIQGCNRFASVIGSVRARTGTEGAASSKFRRANINDRLKILDTILIYLFFDFVPAHAFHALPCTMHTSCITYSSFCEAHACIAYALVLYCY